VEGKKGGEREREREGGRADKRGSRKFREGRRKKGSKEKGIGDPHGFGDSAAPFLPRLVLEFDCNVTGID